MRGLMGSRSRDGLHSAFIHRCRREVQEVSRCQPGRRIVHLLDNISDGLCRAADAAAFCGAVHSCSRWREAALEASRSLTAYMADLNTSPDLWEPLKATMMLVHSLPPEEQRIRGWTVEEIKVGQSLLHEFEQAGMSFPASVRLQYRSLNGLEQNLSSKLMAYQVSRSNACLPYGTLLPSTITAVG
jgi:Zn-dependent oligopeptidase